MPRRKTEVAEQELPYNGTNVENTQESEEETTTEDELFEVTPEVNTNGTPEDVDFYPEEEVESPFGEWSAETAGEIGIKVLLYGASGMGKTRMGATFPRPLFLDLEGGLRSTIRVKSVLRYPKNPKEKITSLDQVKKFYKLVKETQNPNFETIVIDTLTELQGLVSKNVLSKYDANRMYDDQMTMADYGKANRDFLNIIRLFLNLPYHIVFTAHAIQVDDPEQQVYPKFVGKQIGPDLQRVMEMIGFCHVVKGKDGGSEYMVSFRASPRYVAKDRMGIVEKDIPNDYKYLAKYINSES